MPKAEILWYIDSNFLWVTVGDGTESLPRDFETQAS